MLSCFNRAVLVSRQAHRDGVRIRTDAPVTPIDGPARRNVNPQFHFFLGGGPGGLTLGPWETPGKIGTRQA